MKRRVEESITENELESGTIVRTYRLRQRMDDHTVPMEAHTDLFRHEGESKDFFTVTVSLEDFRRWSLDEVKGIDQWMLQGVSVNGTGSFTLFLPRGVAEALAEAIGAGLPPTEEELGLEDRP